MVQALLSKSFFVHARVLRPPQTIKAFPNDHANILDVNQLHGPSFQYQLHWGRRHHHTLCFHPIRPFVRMIRQ